MIPKWMKKIWKEMYSKKHYVELCEFWGLEEE